MVDAEPVIVTRGLTKFFARRKAVDRVELCVRRGEIFGLVGPNGAGKSTTLRMILGLITPTEGEARVAGFDVRSARARALRHVGAIVETPCYYDHMTARMNLEIAASLHRCKEPGRIQEVLGLVDLAARQDDPVATFSTGMRQRLGIARALLHRPQVVILDEPSDALDPGGRQQMRDLILDIARAGTPVLLSSHLLHEMEALCDRVGVLHQGRLLFQGTVAELRASIAPTRRVRLEADRPEAARRVLADRPEVRNVRVEAEGVQVEMADGGDLGALNRALVQADVVVRALHPADPSLEELFLQLTSRSAC